MHGFVHRPLRRLKMHPVDGPHCALQNPSWHAKQLHLLYSNILCQETHRGSTLGYLDVFASRLAHWHYLPV